MSCTLLVDQADAKLVGKGGVAELAALDLRRMRRKLTAVTETGTASVSRQVVRICAAVQLIDFLAGQRSEVMSSSISLSQLTPAPQIKLP